MARITVEDCLVKENNRFALVQLAAKRTKQILGGAKALVASSNKAVVTSLREIADSKVRFMTEEELVIQREKEAQESQSAFERAPILVAPAANIEQLLASSDDDSEDEDEIEDIEDLDEDDDEDEAGEDQEKAADASESDEKLEVPSELTDPERNGNHE